MWEKQPFSFLIFPRICKKIDKKNYIHGIFWAFKGKLQIILIAGIRKIAPQKIGPCENTPLWIFPLWKLSPVKITPQKFAPWENYPQLY